MALCLDQQERDLFRAPERKAGSGEREKEKVALVRGRKKGRIKMKQKKTKILRLLYSLK
jgi:hypothetical protein